MSFRWLYHYIQFIHNHIYYRNFTVAGKENIPARDEAVIVAANHQNAINDPLAIEYAFEKRTVNLFANAGLFRSKVLGKFFRAIHVVPAYRLRTDGEENLSKNYDEFAKVEETLFRGEWIGIFPETTNQTRHFLGEFSLGYLRMAFNAAEKTNFEKDIKILPVGIHYDNYFRFQHDCHVQIGEPISLQPFYELYKSKPRTAQREANKLVRDAIESMMLDMPNDDNYEALDYLRNTYGIKYAAWHGIESRILADKLKSDQQFCKEFQNLAEADSEQANELYGKALELKTLTRSNHLRDWVLTNTLSKTGMFFTGLVLLCLLPVFIWTLIPNILILLAPIPFCKKLDRIGGPFVLFKGGVQIVLSSLITAPILYIIYLFVAAGLMGWLTATFITLMQPLLLIFAWHYYNSAKKYLSLLRYRLIFNRFSSIRALREEIWGKLDTILLKNLQNK